MRHQIAIFLFLFLGSTLTLSAQMQQQEGIRSFGDVLTMYIADNDILNPGQQLGPGINIGYSLGTHHLMARGIGGFEATTDVSQGFDDTDFLKESAYYNPFVGLEVGGGLWRSNGNRCAAKKQYAFTALAKAGLRYNILSREGSDALNIAPIDAGLDYYGAVELGYFFLDSYFKNSEVYLEGGYFMVTGQAYARLGFRTFLNLKAIPQ